MTASDGEPRATGFAVPLLVHSPPPRSNASLLVAVLGRLFVRTALNLLISLHSVFAVLGLKKVVKSPLLQNIVNRGERIGALIPAIKGTTVEHAQLPACEAEWVIGPGVVARHAAVAHFHGGGLVAGGPRTYRRMMSRLSVEAGAPVLVVDYRLLIANAFPDAVEDGVDAYIRLLELGYPDIALSGDSGGGGLALAVAVEVIRRGLPAPKALALISPWADFDPASKCAHPAAATDPLIPIKGSWPLSGGDLIAKHLFASSRAEAAALSPLRQNLVGLPPTLLHVGGTEVLQADSDDLVEALAAAGVPVTRKTWTGQVHLFQLLADLIPEGKQSLAEIGEFIRGRLPPQH